MNNKDWANAIDTNSKLVIFVPYFGEFDRRYHKDACKLLESMWDRAYREGVEKGKKVKAKEIRECLNINKD